MRVFFTFLLLLIISTLVNASKKSSSSKSTGRAQFVLMPIEEGKAMMRDYLARDNVEAWGEFRNLDMQDSHYTLIDSAIDVQKGIHEASRKMLDMGILPTYGFSYPSIQSAEGSKGHKGKSAQVKLDPRKEYTFRIDEAMSLLPHLLSQAEILKEDSQAYEAEEAEDLARKARKLRRSTLNVAKLLRNSPHVRFAHYHDGLSPTEVDKKRILKHLKSDEKLLGDISTYARDAVLNKDTIHFTLPEVDPNELQ